MAALFIHSVIYARGSLVYTQWNICQWRLGLCIVEYLPVADWFIVSEYLTVADWFIVSGISNSGGLVYS